MPKLKQQGLGASPRTMTRVSGISNCKIGNLKETESSSHGREKYITDTLPVSNPYDDQSRGRKLPEASNGREFRLFHQPELH